MRIHDRGDGFVRRGKSYISVHFFSLAAFLCQLSQLLGLVFSKNAYMLIYYIPTLLFAK